MYEGYLELGGGEVLNSARAKGYAATAPCPVNWLQCPPCDGIRDVLGDDQYTYDTIFDAPWYDEEDETTHRFLGAHALSVQGIPDSTREAKTAEATLDGGVVGRVRHATRRMRYRAILTAQGEDALESGFAWLSSALSPGKCDTHADACGATDMQLFTACPPQRSEITKPEVFWNDPVTNLATNPSMETAGAAVAVRTNLFTRPGLETPFGTVEIRRNHCVNPSVEVDLVGWGMTNGTTSQMTRGNNASVAKYGSGFIQYLPATGSVGDSGPSPDHTLGTLQPGESVTASAWVYQSAPFSGGLRMGIYGSALGTDGTQRGAATTVLNQWVRIFHTVTATAVGGVSFFIGNVDGNTPAGAGFFVDGFMIEKTDILRDYFDGSTLPDGDGLSSSWIGAANGSASVRYGQQVFANPRDNVTGYQSGPAGAHYGKAVAMYKRGGWGMVMFEGIPNVAGKTYTIMCDVWAPAPLATLGVSVDMSGGHPGVGLIMGPFDGKRTTLRGTYVGNGDPVANPRMALNFGHGLLLGTEVVYIDNFLVTEGTYTGPYFDGSTPARLRRNLHPNPKPKGYWVTAGDAALSATTDFDSGGPDGGGFRRFTLSTAGGVYAYSYLDAQVSPGVVYTTSVYVRVSAAVEVSNNTVPYKWDGTYGGGEEFAKLTPDPGVWTRIPLTMMPVPVGASKLQVRARIQGAPAGLILDVAMGMVEEGAVLGSYFDGGAPVAPYAAGWDATANESPSYLSDPDFTYAWTGTPNDSTSQQKGLSVATVGESGTFGVSAIQSSQWAADRTKSLRLIDPGSLSDVFRAVDLGNGVVSGRQVTVSITTRVAAPTTLKGAVSLTEQVGWTSLTIIPSGTALNGVQTWTATVDVPAGWPPQKWVLLRGSIDPSVDVWYDRLLVVEGEYPGAYFDGAYPDSTAEEMETVGRTVVDYEWTGTPDASTSTHATGSVVAVEDPVEYERIVEGLVRNLHTVTCVSGPTIEQKLHRGDTWGYIVEFVLVAAVPWMFGITKPVALTPSLPIVVQDVPFNLVPYPSAELESGTVVAATNLVTNPSVEVATTGWTTLNSAKISAAQLVLSKSTELWSVPTIGGSSAKVLFTATATDVNDYFGVEQIVQLPGITPTTRYSVNLWASASVESGTAVVGSITVHAFWENGSGALLRDDVVGTMPAAGGALSAKSLLPPAGTTRVRLTAALVVTSWSTGAKVRLYADAAAVTVP